MKSILYAGAALMIGASVYGFVDFNHSQNKKEFKEMYAEPNPPVEDEIVMDKKVTDSKIVSVIPVAEKKENYAVKNKTVAKKKIAVAKKNKQRIKKQRTFKTKFFGRGALDERYTEPVKQKNK